MIKLFLILAFNICLFANAITTVQTVKKVSSLKVIKGLKYATRSHLKYATKSENIHDLLSLAVKENKITFVKQFQYRKLFSNLKDGDIFLLKCLKSKACDVEKFSEVITKSTLHQKIIRKNPNLSLAQVNIKVGKINENLMDKYFVSSSWKKIEGEVGRNGIDGLFIKKTKDGIIKDVLVVESKYNKSGLQHTKNGQQMTNEWVMKKIKDLRQKYPNNNDYKQIEKLVENSTYRSFLWNLKVNDNNLIFDVLKLHDKSGKIKKSSLIAGEKIKIMQKNNNKININNPKNDFQKRIVTWYKKEVKDINL